MMISTRTAGMTGASTCDHAEEWTVTGIGHLPTWPSNEGVGTRHPSTSSAPGVTNAMPRLRSFAVPSVPEPTESLSSASPGAGSYLHM